MKQAIRNLIALAVVSAASLYSQVTLTPAPTPTSGQGGVTTITLTGSGFPAGTIVASAVTVALTPASGGASVTTVAASVITVLGSTRRVTFLIPSSITVASPTGYKITVSGMTSTGTAFNTASNGSATLTINPPASISQLTPSSGSVGQTLTVTITGAFTNFVQGSTQARFGPDISVGGAAAGSFGPVTILNATSATASLKISSSANPGQTAVDVRTGVQQATLPNAFSVTPPILTLSREYVYLNGQIAAVEEGSSQTQSAHLAGRVK